MKATITRAATADRAADTLTVDVVTDSLQIGPKRRMLPGGALLCMDVPLARAGWMIYGPGETPVPVGEAGVAYVERTHDVLFDPEFLDSLRGSPVTDHHPPGSEYPHGVTEDNRAVLAKGFAMTNIRAGTGDDADVVLGDLVIKDKQAVAKVLANRMEVSVGYDANYQIAGPGLGKQSGLIANHIALVPKGRCGPRCSIGDAAHDHDHPQPTEKESIMPTPRKQLKTDTQTRLDALRATTADALAEIEQLEAEEGAQAAGNDGDVHVHIHQGADEPAGPRSKTEDRVAALEEQLGTVVDTLVGLTDAITKLAAPVELTPEEKAAAIESAAAIERAKTTDGDSKALATGYGEVLALAEVLVPGFRMPTFDAALKRAATVDNMCAARRRCLDAAYATDAGKELIDSVHGSAPDLAKMDCAAAATLFTAAAGAKKVLNNRMATADSARAPEKEQIAVAVGPRSPEDLNKANAEFWAKQA